MSLESWALPYEAPTSLDAARVLGTRPMRSTLWSCGAIVGSMPVVIAGVMLLLLVTIPGASNDDLRDALSTVVRWAIIPTLLWNLFSVVVAHPWGHRNAEYWLHAALRDRAMPRVIEGAAMQKHHAQLEDIPRGVVEVTGTANLRMSGAETASSAIKRLGMFLNGLRFPIQIVVRAWPLPDGLIARRWYIALAADSDGTLTERLGAVVDGLKRSGMQGVPLNGDLYDALQACWTPRPRHADGPLGPYAMKRSHRHVVVDDEYVRGFVLSKMPRTVDANWLAPILDGDLAVDMSLWVDPTDNADELEYLSGRVNEWETAQVLNMQRAGYRDPDIEDCINDAARTRKLLRRRELRVFRATYAFVVRGTTEREMLDREHLLATQLREHCGDDALIPLDLEHDRAPLLVVPTGQPAVEHPLRTVTQALARGHPFSNSSVVMSGGVDAGTSTDSKRENRLNLFGLANPHMVVLGTSGAGKGFYVKVLTERMLDADPDLIAIVIQAEKDEYSALAHHLGPERAEIVRVRSLAELSGLVYPRAYQASRALKTFRQMQLYDLTGMEPHERGQAVAFLLQAVEHSAAWAPGHRRGLVIVDELGIILESDAAALAIETAYRRFRSIPNTDNPRQVNRRAMIGVSQRPSDLLRHPRGKVLADLAMTHVYFRQRATELNVVKTVLGLSNDEANFLDTCDEGTGLLVADRARVGFHLYATKAEERFACT